MAGRAVVQMARGILMASPPYPSADVALEMLETASQRESVRVHDIAERVVEWQSLDQGW